MTLRVWAAANNYCCLSIIRITFIIFGGEDTILSSGADLVVVVGDAVVVEGAAAAVALVPPQAGVGGRVREARGLEAGLRQVRVRVE